MAIPIFPIDLPCNLMAANKGAAGNAFIRSEFDYDPRQRKVKCGKPTFSVAFVMTLAQYTTFLAFWDNDINEGAKEFSADWSVYGIVSAGKVVRFTAPFTMGESGNGYYSVAGTCELLERGA